MHRGAKMRWRIINESHSSQVRVQGQLRSPLESSQYLNFRFAFKFNYSKASSYMSAGDVGFLYFIFYYTLVSNAKGNLAKSNKSELWNHLSYRGLPYQFQVRSQSFRNNCQISRSQPQNLEADFHSTSTTSKGLSENSKKMSWDNPVFPIHTKKSIGFFVQLSVG